MRRLLVVIVLFTLLAVCALSCRKKPTEVQTVAIAVFSLASGTYVDQVTVTIACATADAQIRYTTDGTVPTADSDLYEQPLVISITTTLKAKCFKEGWDASPLATAEYIIFTLPPQMVAIAGGTFFNGSSDITLSPFFISKYEVTQSEYEQVMGNNPSFHNVPNGPVESVSWFNIIEYCNRRSVMEGLEPCYSYLNYWTDVSLWPADWQDSFLWEPYSNHNNISCNWSANGYRLPTEMEWEFAARGGTLSQNFIYSGSNNIDAVAWYSDNAGNTTHPVGLKEPNELGLYDMSGNVNEMLWDVQYYYPDTPQTDPHGPASGQYRCVRGGEFLGLPDHCEVSYRGAFSPHQPSFNRGFRLVLNAR